MGLLPNRPVGRGNPEPDLRRAVPALSLPRAFLIGAKSLSEPDSTDVYVEAGIPRHVIADAGHGMAWENPDGFAQAISDGLAHS